MSAPSASRANVVDNWIDGATAPVCGSMLRPAWTARVASLYGLFTRPEYIGYRRPAMTRGVLLLCVSCAAEGAPAAIERSDAAIATSAPTVHVETPAPRPALASPSPAGEGGSGRGLGTIGFVGDVALTMQIGDTLAKPNSGAPVPPDYPFSHVSERLRSYSLLVGNLECVLSKQGRVATDHNPFRCPRQATGALKSAGFDLLSVANNHAQDFGGRGFTDMLANLDADGVPYFGEEVFGTERQAPVIVSVAGRRVGLLAYYWPPALPLVDVTAARREVDTLMVFNHWGMEDQVEPMPIQQTVARQLIDAGVDLVVGTHAHVPQPVDWYRGKLIAYGLGNFVFNGMSHSELHSTGLVLEVDISAAGIVAHRLIRVRLGRDGVPAWLDDPALSAPLAPAAAAATR
jgi:poly-gamma-glutamate synthesis protein (capsule biosynthesis protein)